MPALYTPNQSRIDHALATLPTQTIEVKQNAIFIRKALLFGGSPNPAANFSGSAYVIPKLGDLKDSPYSLSGQIFLSAEVAWQLEQLTEAVLQGTAANLGIKSTVSKHLAGINFDAVRDFNGDTDKTYRYLNVKGYAKAQEYQQKVAAGQTDASLSVLYEPDLNGLVGCSVTANCGSYKDGKLLNPMSPEQIDPARYGVKQYWDFKDGALPRQHMFGRVGNFAELAKMGESILQTPSLFDEDDVGHFAVADVLVYPYAIKNPQGRVFIKHDLFFILIRDRPFPITGGRHVDADALIGGDYPVEQQAVAPQAAVPPQPQAPVQPAASVAQPTAPTAPQMQAPVAPQTLAPQAPVQPVAPVAPAAPQAVAPQPAVPSQLQAPVQPQAPAAFAQPQAPVQPQAPAAPQTVAPQPMQPQAPAAPVAPPVPQAPVAPTTTTNAAAAFIQGLGQ
nr:MAG TPA: major capsid protein [Caudoviricetes sp.]